MVARFTVVLEPLLRLVTAAAAATAVSTVRIRNTTSGAMSVLLPTPRSARQTRVHECDMNRHQYEAPDSTCLILCCK